MGKTFLDKQWVNIISIYIINCQKLFLNSSVPGFSAFTVSTRTWTTQTTFDKR